jgi:hypothetical protein
VVVIVVVEVVVVEVVVGEVVVVEVVVVEALAVAALVLVLVGVLVELDVVAEGESAMVVVDEFTIDVRSADDVSASPAAPQLTATSDAATNTARRPRTSRTLRVDRSGIMISLHAASQHRVAATGSVPPWGQ